MWAQSTWQGRKLDALSMWRHLADLHCIGWFGFALLPIEVLLDCKNNTQMVRMRWHQDRFRGLPHFPATGVLSPISPRYTGLVPNCAIQLLISTPICTNGDHRQQWGIFCTNLAQIVRISCISVQIIFQTLPMYNNLHLAYSPWHEPYFTAHTLEMKVKG